MQNQQNQQNGQVQEKQQMTEEELQRTQVLNFDTFKKVARYEKISSKKPALIIALIGIFAIIIGGGYPVVKSQLTKNEDNNKSTVQARKKDAKESKTELTCIRKKDALTSITALNEVLTIKYIFDEDKLSSFTKELTLTIPEGSTTGEGAMQTYLTALEPYLSQLDGYKISVKKLENGVTTTTSVDYNNLDVSKVPELNQKNEYFNITYVAGTNKKSISQDMATQEYICS